MAIIKPATAMCTRIYYDSFVHAYAYDFVIKHTSLRYKSQFTIFDYKHNRYTIDVEYSVGLTEFNTQSVTAPTTHLLTPTVNRAELARQYESGKSMAELAKEFGITRSGIQYHLRKARVKMRSAGPVINPATTSEFVVGLYLSGLSMRQIAQKLGVSITTVSRRLRSAGTPIRTDGNRE